MATLTLLLLVIVFAILSVWFAAIPVEMLTGGIKAFSHGGHGGVSGRAR